MLVPPFKYYEELAAKKSVNEKEILLNNFEDIEAEGTELDLENTAEAPIEILKIEGNTIQNGEPSLDNEVEVEGVSEKINFSDNIAEKELENQYRNKAQNGLIIQENGFNSYIAAIKPNKNYLIKNGHSNICLFDANMQYITGYSTFQETVNTDGINNVAFLTVAVEQSKESTFSILEEFRGEIEISLKNKNQLILEDVAETTYYGVSYSCKNGKISLNGTASQPIFIIIPLKHAIKVSKQFTWSALTNKILSTEKEVALWLSNETGSKLFNKDLWLEDTVDRVFTTTPTEETLITRVAFYIGSGFTFNNIEVETQLEYAEEASSIVEGKEQIHTISLGNKVLYGDENSKDCFEISIDKDFYKRTAYKRITTLNLVKNWKKILFDGIENKFVFKSTIDVNNMYVSNNISNILAPTNNNHIIKTYSNYFIGNYSVNNIYTNDIVGVGVANNYSLQFGFGLNSEINTLELANSKLQELNALGKPLYVICRLLEPETETITDSNLINQIENFINNAYTYKEKTSINSKLFLKLKYRKNMYYDLESRVKALEANTL